MRSLIVATLLFVVMGILAVALIPDKGSQEEMASVSQDTPISDPVATPEAKEDDAPKKTPPNKKEKDKKKRKRLFPRLFPPRKD